MRVSQAPFRSIRVDLPQPVRIATGLFVAALYASPLAAQTAARDNLILEEVVVSASRRGDEALQKVPTAISVLSPRDFDNKGLGSLQDIERLLPSVNMQHTGPGVNTIEMRGLVVTGLDTTNAQNRALVSLYLDDAPISLQGFNPDLQVYDLERVEVLRGPQGTLYGAGSMAGAIRFITKKPDTKQFSGDVDGSVSVTQHAGTNYSARGVVNLPLIDDQLGVRVAGFRSTESGFIDNAGTAQSKANAAYSTQGRVAVRWLPADTLTIDASATLERLHSRGHYATFPPLGKYTYSSLTPERFDDNFKLFNLALEWKLPVGSLIASSSYVSRTFADQTTFEYLNEGLVTPGVHLPSNGIIANDVHSFTQELRLVSPSEQKLRWIVGGFFEHLHRYFPQDTPTPGLDAAIATIYGIPGFNSQTLYNTPTRDDLFYGTIDTQERQFALFGEATYTIAPKLDLTVGVRYFSFKEDFNLTFTGFAGAIAPGQPVTQAGTEKPSGANPRATLAYQVNDSLLVFADAARGFRYGGVNEPAPPAFCAAALAEIGLTQSPLTFGPDSLWSYSVGEKGTFAEGRLKANVTGFYIDWRDVQTIKSLNCGYYFAQNKGKVKSEGVEVEFKARATRELTFGLNGSLTRATANGPIGNLGAADGDRVPYFPRVIVSAAAEYAIPVAGGRLSISADYVYRSNAYTDFRPTNPRRREIQASNVVNASATFDQGRWSASLFGTNLTNDLQVANVSANGFPLYQPGDLRVIGRPLTVGLHAHVSF